MKILFTYTNINGFHADSFGDGIAMIMAVTKRAGHNIRQIQIFKKSEYSQLELAVKEFKPDMVGFTAVSSQWSFVLEMAEVVKKISPKTINVCGGVHTTLEPECIVNAKNMNAIFPAMQDIHECRVYPNIVSTKWHGGVNTNFC